MTDSIKLSIKKILVIRERDQIRNEIDSHGRSWCKHSCTNFDPALYRFRREHGYSAKELQTNPKLCHRID
ncbi:hypothetical protein KJ611_04160 [Patescibacteria group bacterium]|nr:hypothetical protein [Patescibacteria group bacterium]MBU1705645.1 hypothetical protein [Patescibacteria group bacterium]